MCAIAGFNWQDKKLAAKMAAAMKHRGPDSGGVWSDKAVSFGHRRLSILDLSSQGNQPMSYKDKVIVFNGEIYNFAEIKNKLKTLGHKFKSETDTEVVLHAYAQWGVECVKRFNGMWAFCIYDEGEQTLFLSRDRFGIKPLYYFFDNHKFIFASELTAIKEVVSKLEINPIAVNFYFYQKYIGGDLTIYEHCYKLLPAHNLIYDLKSNKLQKRKYWDLEKETAKAKKTDVAKRVRQINYVLKDAVEKRLISDVALGSFLSGGLDSSLISALVAKNHENFSTFSIGFKQGSYNELPFSKIAAKHIKTKHHVKYFSFDDTYILELVKKMDEPFGDSSLISTHLLSQFARKKVTVSLSGDGGDEVFGGYDTYLAHKFARFTPPIIYKALKPLAQNIKISDKKLSLGFKIRKFILDYSPDTKIRHANWMSTFNEEARSSLLGDFYLGNSEIDLHESSENGPAAAQLHDIYNYLPGDILKKTDMASMLNSLEVRVPFLDHRLVPLVLSLPESYRIRGFKTKYLLKKIARKYIPSVIINRKKRGFTVPVSAYIRSSKLVKQVLTNSKYYQHSFVNKDYVDNIYKSHMGRKQNYGRQLWLVFVFNLWYYNQKK